jgi:antitoxin VapB
MALNIKDERTERLARRLAEMTGETIATAVATALEKRVAQLERRRSRERLLADVRAISTRFRQHLGEPMTSVDHAELLYDEAGLPK